MEAGLLLRGEAAQATVIGRGLIVSFSVKLKFKHCTPASDQLCCAPASDQVCCRSLSNFNLVGTLPESLVSLTSLLLFSIGWNGSIGLEGTVPLAVWSKKDGSKRLEPNEDNFSQVKLEIEFSRLSGTLPTWDNWNGL